MRSTDSRFAIRKISHPSLCDLALSVCRHQNDEYLGALAVIARFFPIIRLKSCIGFLLFVFSSLNPFKGTIAFDYIGNSGVIGIGSKCGQAGQYYDPADVNQDCYVDLNDLGELGLAWLTNSNPADINQDGYVDLNDLEELGLIWLTCRNPADQENCLCWHQYTGYLLNCSFRAIRAYVWTAPEVPLTGW